MHTVREIPGFLSFAAVLFLIIMREQTLGLVSLTVIGAGVAMTGPSEPARLLPDHPHQVAGLPLLRDGGPVAVVAMVRQAECAAPARPGAVRLACATIAAYGLIFLVWRWLGLGYVWLFRSPKE